MRLIDEICNEIKKDALQIKKKEPNKRFMDVSIPNLIDFARFRVEKRRKRKLEK